MKETTYPRQTAIELAWVHHAIDQVVREKLIYFWLRNGAITDAFEAWRRSYEVCCIAYDERQEIVAICSVYPARSTLDGRPFWLFRAFSAPTYRRFGIASKMFEMTFLQLGLYPAMIGAPVGVEFVAENQKLNKAGLARKLHRNGYQQQGIDRLGQSVWRKLFVWNSTNR